LRAVSTSKNDLQGFSSEVYASLSRELEGGLFAEACTAENLRPKWTSDKVWAVLLALLVHGLTLGLAAVGILLLADVAGRILMVLGGICLLVAWFVRPRLGRKPSEMLLRAQAPSLYKAVDDVAQRVGTRRVRGIALSPEFNSSVKRAGSRIYMQIGAPFFMILDPQERIALFAHELAHLVNGDPLRGAVLSSALSSLDAWYSLMRPGPIPPRRSRFYMGKRTGRANRIYSRLIDRTMGVVLTTAVRWYASALIHLAYRPSQQGEYLADDISRRVAGSDAATSTLRKLSFVELFQQVVQGVSLAGAKGVIEEFKTRARATQAPTWPAAESRVDSTHPRTELRIEFVASETVPASLVITQGESDQIDRELEPFLVELDRRLRDDFLAGLYR
jgi:Zn-dependent protease with chaperone function